MPHAGSHLSSTKTRSCEIKSFSGEKVKGNRFCPVFSQIPFKFQRLMKKSHQKFKISIHSINHENVHFPHAKR